MDILKSTINLIVSAAELVDVDIVFAILIMYLAVVALLFLIKILRGVPK